MDGTVRVWNLTTGQCVHTLTGHTSLVGLLGLSPSHLVSAAADSSLRVWNPDTGELKHTLAAHTGAITCFQHDEFKVLSGSDGTLKMWDIRDGSFVRDFLVNIQGVWQVVFEGRWCVAASNRMEATVLDVWDFGAEDEDDWHGEPANGMYDDSTDDEDDEMEQADADAMDQDLEVIHSDKDMEDDLEVDRDGIVAPIPRAPWATSSRKPRSRSSKPPSGSGGFNLPAHFPPLTLDTAGPSSSPLPQLPFHDESPTKPRTRRK